MSDDWLDTPVARADSREQAANQPRRSASTSASAGLPAELYLVAQSICILFGLYARFSLPPGWTIAGYLTCGIAVPFLWASLFVRLRGQEYEDKNLDRRNRLVGRFNRWLLLVSLLVGLMCAWVAATEWSK